MGSGFAAGAGADMLRQVLQQKFEQALAMNQMKLAQQRLSDENTRFYSGQDFQAGQNKLGREFTHGENESAHTFTHGENEAGRTFTHGENEAGRAFTSGENQKGREFTHGENEAGRTFTAGENLLGRGFTASQNSLNRGNALRIAGMAHSGNDEGQFTSVQQGVGPDGKPGLLIVNRRTNSATPVTMPQGYEVNRPARPVTGAERQTLNYFNRMLEAEKNARGVEDKIGNWDSTVSDAPGVPGFLENWLHSDAGQKYVQAQRMFTEARLRKESGAAIPENEFANDRRMNFRSSGDRPDTLAQKRNSRVTTMRGLGNAAGRALQEFYGENATVDDLLKEFADQPATMRARDPQGVLHEAPAGTDLPPGWKLEK